LIPESCTILLGLILSFGQIIAVINRYTLRTSDLVLRVPGYTTEMYCVSCEVRTEFIYVM
jgi:hypothetical protein